MRWLTKGKDQTIELRPTAGVEVRAHKDATKEVIKETKDVSDKLNNLLAENGFSFTIWIAAGGSSETLTTKASGETKKNWKRVR